MNDFGGAIAIVWCLMVLVATAVLAALLGVIAHLLGYPWWWGVAAAVVIGGAVLWWSRG